MAVRKLLDGETTSTSASTQTTIQVNAVAGIDRRLVWVEGTFDGATVTFRAKPPGGSEWLSLGTDTVFTGAGLATILVPCTMDIRADVTSAGSSTDLTAAVVPEGF